RTVEADLRQSPRTVGIVREILVDPAGRVDAGFVDQGGPKRVIPDRGHGAVDVGGVEMVHQAIATPTGVTCPINGGARIWHVVVRGEPRFSPWPAIKWQLVPSIKPAWAQVRSTIVPPLGATPG